MSIRHPAGRTTDLSQRTADVDPASVLVDPTAGRVGAVAWIAGQWADAELPPDYPYNLYDMLGEERYVHTERAT